MAERISQEGGKVGRDYLLVSFPLEFRVERERWVIPSHLPPFL
jgi:hypothetical protein